MPILCNSTQAPLPLRPPSLNESSPTVCRPFRGGIQCDRYVDLFLFFVLLAEASAANVRTDGFLVADARLTGGCGGFYGKGGNLTCMAKWKSAMQFKGAPYDNSAQWQAAHHPACAC